MRTSYPNTQFEWVYRFLYNGIHGYQRARCTVKVCQASPADSDVPMDATLESEPESDRLAKTVELLDGCCCSDTGQRAADSDYCGSSTQVGMDNRRLRRTLDICGRGLKEAIWNLTGMDSLPPAGGPSFVAFALSSWHRLPSFFEGYRVAYTVITVGDCWGLQNSFRPGYNCQSASLYGVDKFERHGFLPQGQKHDSGGISVESC